MSNLRPEARVNKLGHTVIKHIRVDGGVSGTGASPSIPAPALPLSTAAPKPDPFELLDDDGFGFVDSHGVESARFLHRHCPELFERIAEDILHGDTETRVLWRWSFTYQYAYSGATEDDSEEERAAASRMFFTRLLKNAELAVLLFPDTNADSRLRAINRLARDAESLLGWKPGSKRYAEVQAAMVLSAIDSSYRLQPRSGRGPDIFFLADNFERVLPLVPELMRRNGTVSADLIRSMMENPTLADGML